MGGETIGRKLLYLPEPFPDETLHSIFSRYHKLSCYGDYRQSLEELTGRKSCNSFQDVPTCLGALEARAAGISSLTVERLLRYHTSFPYFQRFLLPSQISICHQRVLGQMERRGGGRGLGFAHMRGQFLSRFCPKCLEDDQSNFGQPYWHRVHQLPGVWICPWHRNVLRHVDSVWLAKDPRRLFLPDDMEVLGTAESLKIDHDVCFLVKLSLNSSLLLFSEDFLFDLSGAHKATRDACYSSGLISSERLNSEKITSHLSRVLQSLPSAGEFNFLVFRKNKLLPLWVFEVLRAPYRYRHPLEYLILWDALGLRLTSAGIVFNGDLVSERDVWSVHSVVGKNSGNKTRAECFEEVARRRKDFLSDNCVYASRRASYKWLLINDREWLDAHKQSCGRGRKKGYSVEEWVRRDVEISGAIMSVVDHINSRSGAPVRITIGLILRELGLSRHLLSYFNRMPRSRSILLSVQESRYEFIHKRAAWAYRAVMEEKGYCDQSTVLRYANVKKPENWLEIFESVKIDCLKSEGS